VVTVRLNICDIVHLIRLTHPTLVGNRASTLLSKRVLQVQQERRDQIALYNGVLKPSVPLTLQNVALRLLATTRGKQFDVMTQWSLRNRAVEELEFIKGEREAALVWARQESFRLSSLRASAPVEELRYWNHLVALADARREQWVRQFVVA
jgi:hypothetical protein